MPISQRYSLSNGSAPKATDTDIAKGTCAIPGPGRYNGFNSVHFGGIDD